MSDSERQNGFMCEPDGAESLAEFPSELVPSEPVQQSSPHAASQTPDEPDSLRPQVSDAPVRPVEPPVEPPVGRRWRVAGLVAAIADLTWIQRSVARSRDALRELARSAGHVRTAWLRKWDAFRGLVRSAGHVRTAWLRKWDALRGPVKWGGHLRTTWLRITSSFVGAFRSGWMRAALHARSSARATRALLRDVSSRAGRTFSSIGRVQRPWRPERARALALFLSGVVVGAALVTAARWPFAATATTAASRDQLGSAVADSQSAAALGRANGEVQGTADGSGVSLHDADSPGTSAQEEAAEPPGPYHGSLVINSDPRGAEVFVNGERVGKTPLVLDNLQIGSRAVRLRLDGHESWSRAIDVVANHRSSVVAQLQPSRR
jgi:PEGA domain